MRKYEFLQPAEITLLTDRRVSDPCGLDGGNPGQSGTNRLTEKEAEKEIPGKCTISVEKNDVLTIETPGGGGYGKP